MSSIVPELVDYVNQMTSLPDISPHHPLLDRLQGLMHQVKGRMLDGAQTGGHGLPPVEARVLSYFARHPGSTQRALVQHSGRDKAQIARIVKGLLERGLLQGDPDPADGRSVLLGPTEAGLGMHRRLHQQRMKIESELMNRLSETQRRQLLASLDRLLAVPDDGARE